MLIQTKTQPLVVFYVPWFSSTGVNPLNYKICKIIEKFNFSAISLTVFCKHKYNQTSLSLANKTVRFIGLGPQGGVDEKDV